VDLGVLEGYPSDTIDSFTDRLLELLPGIWNHTCSRGVKGGFVDRLREGTWLGHVAEHVALQLQQEAGHDQRRGKTRMVKGQPGRYNVIYGYTDEGVGLAAGSWRCGWSTTWCRPTRSSTSTTELESSCAAPSGPPSARPRPPSSRRPSAATSRSSGSTARSLVQLGQGVHQQRIRATMTSKTGALAVDIASDKDLTTKLLASAGLPVPKQETVRTADGAVAAARSDRLPRRGQAARR
jgi:cyanophycin synthetase